MESASTGTTWRRDDGPSGRSSSATRGTQQPQQPSAGPRQRTNASPARATTARSGSQPKQRGGAYLGSSSASATAGSGQAKGNRSTTPSRAPPSAPPPTPYELALSRISAMAAGMTDDQAELLLQQLLQRGELADAAYLIASRAALAAKFKTADVIRLMLERNQFDKAAQLIREMKLQSNQLLVTLFIKELVRASLFQSAVRYAQEMVENFGKTDLDPASQARPSWTPHALVQAMIRAQQYRTALKYAKQFELFDLFPPVQLIASMFELGRWDDAVTSILELRLFTEFPLEALVLKLLEHRQWTCALKCINKLPSKDVIDKYNEVLVKEAARAGDFIVALRYLREFKLDQPGTNGPLLRYFVDCLIGYVEFYKAIKYSIKFELNIPSKEEEETGEKSAYDTEVLIRRAIEYGQYHVASTYIKKLKMKDKFAKELEMIEAQRQRMASEFREFLRIRDAQAQQAHNQHQLAFLLGDKIHEEFADLVVESDVVLSQEEEILPRKPRAPLTGSADEVVPGTEAFVNTETASESVKTSDGDQQGGAQPPRQSRFSFARSEDSTSTASSTTMQPPPARPRAPPPGLTPSPTHASPKMPEPTGDGASNFNFSHFAASLNSNAGPQDGQPPPQNQQFAPLFPIPPANSAGASGPSGFYPPLPPTSQPPSHHHFSVPPPPPPMPMYYQGQIPNQPPPMTSRPPQSNGVGFDISSLAMQFHTPPARPPYPGAYNMPNAPPGYGPRGPAPPLPPGIPAGLFPPMPPMTVPAQPPSTFKPSMSYTSVTTTRKKAQP